MRLWQSELDLEIDSSRMPKISIKACTEDKLLNHLPPFSLSLLKRRKRKVKVKPKEKGVKAKRVRAKRKKKKIQNG